jgi:hypothetical protein
VEISFEQFTGMYYATMDAIKRGDIDHADIQRTWENEDGVVEGVMIAMGRDAVAEHAAKKLDDVLAELKELK